MGSLTRSPVVALLGPPISLGQCVPVLAEFLELAVVVPYGNNLLTSLEPLPDNLSDLALLRGPIRANLERLSWEWGIHDPTE